MNHSFKYSAVLILLIGTAIYFTSCMKETTLPVVTTINVSDITQTSISTGGTVIDDGGAEVTARGVCWSTVHNPTLADTKTTDGTGSGTFSSNISGLTANTTYYIRAYATNSVGTAYGNEIPFNLKQILLATLTTAEITEITVASAVSGIVIIDNGGEEATEWGICWGTSPVPTTSNYKTKFDDWDYSDINNITGLQPSTKYYVRSYAINRAGTAYGNELEFTTLAVSPIIFNPVLTYGSVSDIDGNDYMTIQIGTQVWMAENLRTTRYSDGTSIPYITESTETTHGFSWYNNELSSYKTVFGALYNWYAVADSRNLCPTGWHVPTSTEWSTLKTYLGDETVAGGRLKEKGTTHWLSPNYGGFNESGFSALPGGWYYFEEGFNLSQFNNIGYQGSWWTSTSAYPGTLYADIVIIGWSGPYLSGDLSNKLNGFSVRCIKNN
ncbi:MAG: hypothetical protein IQL11_04070 [Bacteroidales bacterium]|nr:hypothetical protein [Bacteroidales bacterium]